ncbi:MAG: CAP domain-containing protein [Candidatus Doudnabacteria bacterium]|nr:CAP domain-containing protein [Candidatus Doudnabacteria bacterium]
MKLTQYLVASETNDYKPWIITPAALAVFCLIIWSLRLILPSAVTLASGSIDATDVMNKINAQRSARFIPTLNTNSKLITAASGKARDMLSRSYFSHIDPDGHYVWPRIEAAGYKPYITLGENLAMDFSTADGMVDAWMNSPTHRANIVNSKFVDQGLASIAGTYEANHDTIVVVSLFGALYKSTSATPVSPSPLPVIKNPTSSTSALKISNDIKVTDTFLSGKILVDIDVIIAGGPSLVTATLKGQSITLIAGQVKGQYIGNFTFDASEDLADQTLKVEARDKSGIKATLDYPINIMPQPTDSVAGDAKLNIPVSEEAGIMRILRIIFGIFATIYMGFLAFDAIIIHRAKIKREGVHPNSHLLVFALVAAVSLFTSLL